MKPVCCGSSCPLMALCRVLTGLAACHSTRKLYPLRSCDEALSRAVHILKRHPQDSRSRLQDQARSLFALVRQELCSGPLGPFERRGDPGSALGRSTAADQELILRFRDFEWGALRREDLRLIGGPPPDPACRTPAGPCLHAARPAAVPPGADGLLPLRVRMHLLVAFVHPKRTFIGGPGGEFVAAVVPGIVGMAFHPDKAQAVPAGQSMEAQP